MLEVTQDADLGKETGISIELPSATKKLVDVLSSQWLKSSFIVMCGHIVAKSADYLLRARPSLSIYQRGSHWKNYRKI